MVYMEKLLESSRQNGHLFDMNYYLCKNHNLGCSEEKVQTYMNHVTCLLPVLQVDPAPVCVPYIAVLLLLDAASVVAELLVVVLLVQATTASWRLTRSS